MKLSKIAKSPLTYIALAAAIAAFAIGLFVSARMNGIAASGPREVVEVVVEVPVTYRNPDGAWPSPIPTSASGPREVLVDHTDKIIYRNPDGTWPSPIPTSTPSAGLSDDYDPIMEPDAIGIATMGKLLYLFGGGSIQLPDDVYVKDFLLLPEPCSGSNCPEHPVAVLGRGNDWVAVDRHGNPIPGWSNSPAYKPDRFKFLNE